MINMDMVSSLNDKEFTLKMEKLSLISRNMRQEIRQKYADYEFTPFKFRRRLLWIIM